MSSKNDLTLLLTLWGRVPYTLRWLNYAESVRFPFKILLADGSNDADAQSVEAAVKDGSKFPHLNIDYVRYPEDKGLPDYFKKLENAFSHIKTPFTVMGDNDDFPVVSGLKECLNFLRGHEDYASCGGRCGGIYIEDGVYGEPRFEKFNPCFNIEGARASDRVLAHFNRYQLTWYDVHPTALLRSCYQRLREADLRDLFLAELLMSFLTAAEGKIKKIPLLTLVRQHLTPQTSSGEARKKGDALARMLQGTWSQDFSRFTDAIARVISEKDSASLTQAQDLICEGYKRYAVKSISKTLNGSARLSPLKSLLKSGLNHKSFELLRGKYNWTRTLSWAKDKDREGLAAIREFLAAHDRVRS